MRWMSILSNVLVLSVLLVCNASATVPAFQQLLSPVQNGAPSPIQFFGQNQAVDGNLLAVGAPHSTGGATNTPGTVFIYQRAGADWTYLQALRAPSPAAGDGFGYSVTLVGNSLLVGAPFANSGRGSLHLYGLSGNSFQLLQSFAAPMDVGTDGWFGLRSAVDSGWLAIAAPTLLSQGAVYMYRFDTLAESWVAHSKLVGNATALQRFGFALALRGDHLLVGSPLDLESGNVQGNAHAFTRSGNGSAAVWSQSQRFRMTADVGVAAPQLFGLSLSMNDSATRLAVGAPQAGEVGGTTVVGAVFVFERTANSPWTQVARLDSPFNTRRTFGVAVSMDNDLILAGDPQDVATGVARGAAFLYRRNSQGAWLNTESWYRNSGIQGDNYGVSTAIAGTQFLVGGSTTNGSGPGTADEGRVFVMQADKMLRDGFE